MAADPSRDGGRAPPSADAAAADGPAPDAVQARRILELLRDDDIDAAIETGLARARPLPELDAAANARLSAARDRLLAAWAARERHRARARRLERIAAARQQARAARQPAPPPDATGAASPGTLPRDARPALPAAAAAALARARARAAGSRP